MLESKSLEKLLDFFVKMSVSNKISNNEKVAEIYKESALLLMKACSADGIDLNKKEVEYA